MHEASARPLNIAVLISGSGTTLRNLLQRIPADRLDLQIRLVIASRPDAGGLQYAVDGQIPTAVVSKATGESTSAYSDRIFALCREAQVELVVMGGFLKHVLIPDDFAGRVVNIHPSLIPAFCGRGYFGHHVHEAVLEYGAKVSGCTIHFVDNEYDHGPIIAQHVVPVLEGDTPESLAQRVFAVECLAYPNVLQAIAEGRVVVKGRQVLVRE